MEWIPVEGHSSRQTSKAWDFMGYLLVSSQEASGSENKTKVKVNDQLFCKYCFDEQLNIENGRLSKVYSASLTTGSGNHLAHASAKHSKCFVKPQDSKITSWFSKIETNVPASNQFEFNRDLALLICRDLEPFHTVNKPGFTSFCKKNLGFDMPSSTTIATAALFDIFDGIKTKVKEILSLCIAGTLMMDGWTDKYKRLPYIAIRISVIHNWEFKVFTLALQPVESHTADCLQYFVKEVIGEYLPKKILLFDTTDAAANMKLLSTKLGHERTNCIAHCMHLILTTDSINKLPQLSALLKKCKEMVSALHFKGYMVSNEVAAEKDAQLFEKICLIQEHLLADENNKIEKDDDDQVESNDDSEHQCAAQKEKRHVHQTLKTEVPTRWNSILEMIESILDLKDAADNVLKKIGKYDLCLDEDDVELLQELRRFLVPFRELTHLVSEFAPNLSCVPLMITRIQNVCADRLDQETQAVVDSPIIGKLKKLVKAAALKRLVKSKLVNICCCLDPSVRDVVMKIDECAAILRNTYEELRKSKY